jgi:chemotaxis protein CheX
MKDTELKIFVEGVANFFGRIDGTSLTIGVPYIKQGNEFINEITGVIGLTGKRKGSIFITCALSMVDDVIMAYTGTEDKSEEARKDMIGEIANVISGNACEALGSEFKITVPVVVTGKPTGVDMPARVPAFVIPIEWKGHKAHLVAGVE